MTVYYNEIDAHAAAWLRELIKAGHIAPGEVDERSIEDVVPSELMGFNQCHFFAGIGIWSHALRQAGWPDDRPVWTGSCPCQPFSAAGKGGGTSDERHLWPAFFWLIRQCRPVVVFGEQVEAALRHDWLDHVALDLEDCGYSVGAVSSPACGYGAPHIRQRLYWVADSRFRSSQRDTGSVLAAQAQRGSEGQHDGDLPIGHPAGCPARLVADAEGRGLGIGGDEARPGQGRHADGAGILGDSDESGWQGQRGSGQGRVAEPGPTNGYWRNAEWIPCRDGKARPTGRGIHPLVGRMEHAELRGCESGQLRVVRERTESQRAVDTGKQEARPTQSSPLPLAHGAAARVVRGGDQGAPADEIDPQNTAEARVMRLRGYGNAITATQAAAFIKAYMEVQRGR